MPVEQAHRLGLDSRVKTELLHLQSSTEELIFVNFFGVLGCYTDIVSYNL